MVMRIKEQGSLWSAPVCSTWGYLARSTTKRSRGNPSGQIAFNRTRNANRMVVLMSMLTLLAWTRNVHVWLEQPHNSCMQTLEPFKSVCEHVLTEQCLTYLWQLDQRGSCKPLRICSSHPLVSLLSRDKPPKGKGKLAKREGGRITGIKKALRESQSYPAAFGEAVADAFHQASAFANPCVFRTIFVSCTKEGEEETYKQEAFRFFVEISSHRTWG